MLSPEVGLSFTAEIRVFQAYSYKTTIMLVQLWNLEIEHTGDICALRMMITNARHNFQSVNKYTAHNKSN